MLNKVSQVQKDKRSHFLSYAGSRPKIYRDTHVCIHICKIMTNQGTVWVDQGREEEEKRMVCVCWRVELCQNIFCNLLKAVEK
jgi:hypothetical protein